MSSFYDIKNQVEDDDFNGLSYSAQFSNHFAQENKRKLITQQLKDYEQNVQLSREALHVAKESLRVSQKSHKVNVIILIITTVALIVGIIALFN